MALLLIFRWLFVAFVTLWWLDKEVTGISVWSVLAIQAESKSTYDSRYVSETKSFVALSVPKFVSVCVCSYQPPFTWHSLTIQSALGQCLKAWLQLLWLKWLTVFSGV